MKKYFQVLLLVFIVAGSANGQEQDRSKCATTGMTDWFEDYISHREDFQFDRPESTIWLPLSIHILGKNDGSGYYQTSQLIAALCQLNEDFLPSNLQFYIQGEIDYIDRTSWYDHENFSSGIQMMNANNIPKTVNCYFVRNPAEACGYYTGQGNAVALAKSCTTPSDHTWAHELGHFFSLPHTFVGWEGTNYNGTIPGGNRRGVENVARTNCRFTADGFCDTPADYLSFRWNCGGGGRSTISQTDPTGESFQSDGTLFMSYSSDRCSARFSTEQMEAMNANIQTRRKNLLVNPSILNPITESIETAYPENDAAVDFENATINWHPVENATAYHVRVSRIATLTGIFNFEGVVTDTFVNLPELRIGRTYYWRVQPFNNFSFCSEVSTRHNFIAAALTSSNTIHELDFNVFPIPLEKNEKTLIVQGLSSKIDLQYTIIDMHGKMIEKGNVSNLTINLSSSLTGGVYELIINNGNKVGNTRIVVQ